MDKNTIIGILLIGAIFIGYSYYNNNKLEKAYETEISFADSLYTAGDYDEAILAYRKAQSYSPRNTYPQDQITDINRKMGLYDEASETTVSQTQAQEEAAAAEKNVPARATGTDPAGTMLEEDLTGRYGVFGNAAAGEQEFYTLENEKIKLVLSNKGGKLFSAELKDYQTHDTLPLVLFDGDSTVFGLQFFTAANLAIETNDLFFTAIPAGNNAISMRLNAGEGKYIEYAYSLREDEYMLDMDLRVVGLEEELGRNVSALDLNWEIYMPQQEKGRTNEDQYAGLKYRYFDGEVDGSRQRSGKDSEEFDVATKLQWIAYKDQFFSSVIIADEPFLNAWAMTTKQEESSSHLRLMQSKITVPYKSDPADPFKMHFYLGPNHFKTLKSYGLELEELVFLGKNIIRFFNEYFIIKVFGFLSKYMANYGLIILLLTLIVKLLLSPFTYKSYLSQAKMKVLKPQIDEINAKFSKQDEAMKKQQATMALYKKAGVSPLGGCLPMALQMPILFAMFRFFPTSIELRHQSFLWATDLSTYDSIFDLPFTIPMYGDHISLFTLLMTASTILTMKINSPTQTSTQMPGMKGMMYMMPVMFMLILNNFSAGLTYYYFLANLITFGQNMISKRFVDDKEILRKLEANKKKPAKKSKWQQRLEDAAKQKGIKPAKK